MFLRGRKTFILTIRIIKKLKLKLGASEEKEILQREDLKRIIGGNLGSGSSGNTTSVGDSTSWTLSSDRETENINETETDFGS